MNAQEIDSKARSSSTSSNGCWCIFVPLSDTEGLKLYPDKEMRDGAVELQSDAARHGLGPEVKNENVEMPMLSSWDKPFSWSTRGFKDTDTGSTLYGYVTEIVTEGIPDWDMYQDLIERLDDHGLSTSDLCQNMNVGMTLDGRAVMFDFDPIHVEKT